MYNVGGGANSPLGRPPDGAHSGIDSNF